MVGKTYGETRNAPSDGARGAANGANGQHARRLFEYMGADSNAGAFALKRGSAYYVRVLGVSRAGKVAAEVSRGSADMRLMYESREVFERFWRAL